MTEIRLNSTKLQARVSSLASEAARKAANRVALRTRASILGQNRYNTGEMMSSIRVDDVTTDPRRPTWRVHSTSKHFRFQNQGTGNPPGVGRIYPRRPGGVLRFRPKGSSVFIYARSVRGVKPGYFLQRAVAATTLKDFTDPL